MGVTCAALFMYYDKVPGDEVFIEKGIALVWLKVAAGTVLVLFACFLKLMKKKYRKTFFSLETGNEYAQKFFLEGETDEHKVAILGQNRYQWESIRGQVGDFTKANWAKWEEEEPAWFNERFKASIDDDLLPPEVLRAMVLGGGGKRRRSSLAEMLDGHVGGVGRMRSTVGERIGMARGKTSKQRVVPIGGRVGE
jgi:hypothetical protein